MLTGSLTGHIFGPGTATPEFLLIWRIQVAFAWARGVSVFEYERGFPFGVPLDQQKPGAPPFCGWKESGG